MSNGEVLGVITEFKRFATHDGPGIRTTVFVKGCPLRCVWCSNPETWEMTPQLYFKPQLCVESGRCVDICPEKAIAMSKERKIDRLKCNLCFKCVDACLYGALEKVGKVVSVEEVMRVVERDLPFYQKSGGGLTLSGGEPLHQPTFTSGVFKRCKESGIHTTLDTCGYARPDVVEEVLKYTDLVLLDIKHMDSEKHKKYTGVGNELILHNARIMARRCEVRISLPLIPGLNDSYENIRATAEFAKSLGVKYIDIEPLHKFGDHKYRFLGLESPYKHLTEPTREEVLSVKREIESMGIQATVGRMM
jgi:pyruvate formate lyase activating enzyme